jgi:hypothetical protein
VIYSLPGPDQPVDQADIVDGVPLLEIQRFNLQQPNNPGVGISLQRVLVLTQTCDLAQQKTSRAVVAQVFDAAELIRVRIVKESDVRGPIRAARVWGVYFLPRFPDANLPEMIVDFRHVQSIPLHILQTLCQAGHRRARLQCPYREHLAQHFANTYSRIGLPMPYETE